MIVKKGEVYYADLNPIIGCEQADNNNSSCYCPQEKESATDSYKG